jgi:predicted ATPase/DNA-binding winged helix-turn-helix (wHTH) protein
VRKDGSTDVPAPLTEAIISFGPFRLVASERLITNGDVPVPVGARAFDILIALLSRPNEVISKRDLLAQVWPDVTVEESSLRFHIGSLRKALRDGQDGARYITTVAGKGYCFVGRVSRLNSGRQAGTAVPARLTHTNLPNHLNRMVGRDEDLLRVSTDVLAEHLVTIVGPGGVGKTTLAVAIGHRLMEAFAGAVLFVDLGVLSDSGLVATTISSMLGVPVQSDDARPCLLPFLRNKRLLLILDNCEHLIEAVAVVASRILLSASRVHMLMTSREVLQVEGEHVYRLESLACPPDDKGLTAAFAQTFPAPELFIERATANGARLGVSDAEVATVVSICRKLDGVPLAIELAARHVAAYGLRQTEVLLDQHLSLLWPGSRTAPPRQRTLHATLDWSYGLLSQSERVVLRRLAVFVGYFTLDAALAVVATENVDRMSVLAAIDSLVFKSMVSTRLIGATMHYRLLDTTRSYAREIEVDAIEAGELAGRHATYYRQWLEETEAEWQSLPQGAGRVPYFAGLNNARAALEWCFSVPGDAGIGVALAAAAVPIFFAVSLLTECHRWSEQALLALDGSSRGGREEMQLQARMGLAMTITRGNSEAAASALNRSLAIAKARGDLLNEVRLLAPLHLYHMRRGDFEVALQYARRCSEIASALVDPSTTALARALIGVSLHLMGDLRGGRKELEAALSPEPDGTAKRTTYFGCDHYSWADSALTTTLWLQGFQAQAAARAHQALKDAEQMHHPVSLAKALNAVMILLWIEDLDAVEQHVDWFISSAESRYARPYLDLGCGLRGDIAIRRGNIAVGVGMLQHCLQKLHAEGYERLTTRFNLTLVRGLAAAGRFDDGVSLLEETSRLIMTKGDASYLPELLRLRGSIFLVMPKPRVEDAERCFLHSLEVSRTHGSRTWELRTATDLARQWVDQGRPNDARALLQPVFEQFTEGFDTADLKAAEHVLATLGQLQLL